jgi:uncharacterized protein YjeT (DUF2065 family)
MIRFDSNVAVTLIAVGLTLGGSLMLIRPELFRDIPPDENVTPRSTRIAGLVLLVLGICILWQLLEHGFVPCAPIECSDF